MTLAPLAAMLPRDPEGWAKYIVAVAAGCATLWGIGRVLLAPAIEKALRTAFRVQLEELTKAVTDATECVKGLRDVTPRVNENAENIEAIYLFLDLALGIDRREDAEGRHRAVRELHDRILSRGRRDEHPHPRAHD